MRDILIKVPDITLHDLGGLVIRNGEKEFRLAGDRNDHLFAGSERNLPSWTEPHQQVTANLDVGYSLDKVADEIRFAVKDIDLPANYLITVTGRGREAPGVHEQLDVCFGPFGDPGLYGTRFAV